MPKSLQFTLAAGSMLMFASTAMAQHATVRFNPLFEVQPQISQEYPYSILPSMTWRAVPSRMLVGISGVISGKLKVPDQAARSIR
jgi:hypothetical protein